MDRNYINNLINLCKWQKQKMWSIMSESVMHNKDIKENTFFLHHSSWKYIRSRRLHSKYIVYVIVKGAWRRDISPVGKESSKRSREIIVIHGNWQREKSTFTCFSPSLPSANTCDLFEACFKPTWTCLEGADPCLEAAGNFWNTK